MMHMPLIYMKWLLDFSVAKILMNSLKYRLVFSYLVTILFGGRKSTPNVNMKICIESLYWLSALGYKQNKITSNSFLKD